MGYDVKLFNKSYAFSSAVCFYSKQDFFFLNRYNFKEKKKKKKAKHDQKRPYLLWKNYNKDFLWFFFPLLFLLLVIKEFLLFFGGNPSFMLKIRKDFFLLFSSLFLGWFSGL